jgi:hypothetical protein
MMGHGLDDAAKPPDGGVIWKNWTCEANADKNDSTPTTANADTWDTHGSRQRGKLCHLREVCGSRVKWEVRPRWLDQPAAHGCAGGKSHCAVVGISPWDVRTPEFWGRWLF